MPASTQRRPHFLQRFGHSAEDAFAVGLTCGGVIDLLVTPVRLGDPDRETLTTALNAFRSRETIAPARITDGPAELLGRAIAVRPDGSYEGSLGGRSSLSRIAAAHARAMLEAGAREPASSARTGPPAVSP